jgi:D-alanyl-D-alanine carboxypeptidase
MRTLLVTALLLVVGLIYLVPIEAYELPFSDQNPSYTSDGTRPGAVSAKAWGIYDTETGELLFGKEADAARPIASVTKLMTASVALGTLPLEATTTLSKRAIATEGKAGGLKAGEVFTTRELLFPLILSSSNDAAEAIAEREGREKFLATMNAEARELGMTHTHYDDPSGLSPSSTSSVSDLAKLVSHLVREQPYLIDISQLDTYVGASHTWKNINPASHVATYRGGKHGYTDEANRTLAAVFEEEVDSDAPRSFTIVLLGSDNLKTDIETLRGYLRAHLAYR